MGRINVASERVKSDDALLCGGDNVGNDGDVVTACIGDIIAPIFACFVACGFTASVCRAVFNIGDGGLNVNICAVK